MRGGRRWRPSCAPLAASEPPWPGPRLPSGPGGSRQVRWRGVQERDFKGCIQVGFVDRGGQPRSSSRALLGSQNKLSPSSQGDVGSESGDREDHIHYRDRAYRSVRFVRLGTGDEEARRAKMLDAVQRSVALKACRAHRTVCIPRSSSRGCPLDIRVGKWPGYTSAKRFGDTFVDRELETRVFRRFASPAHVPRSGTSVGPRPQTVDRLAVVGPRILPTVAVSKAKSERP
ncbi:hypothetical protein EVAR_91656_1 [Eumeta japonica]|uniref:Uncharacterized protein n=1 Tax=Eumeta variegata TaxID=151549 RepID=A0A4C1Z1B8_EUMVA|nr:hypothetical protein EVAR_91656_1 [Eumeta japonica]